MDFSGSEPSETHLLFMSRGVGQGAAAAQPLHTVTQAPRASPP